MKKNLAILIVLFFAFTIISCPGGGGGGGTDGGSNTQTAFYDGPDPTTQTTALNPSATGAQTYTGNSSGNKSLPGSSYGYEIYVEGGKTITNSLTWYGPSQGGGPHSRLIGMLLVLRIISPV
uniref:Uncharacterized protein n=1 Tax=uncultured bacterium contig00160 TaxID=1181593 RepID=A0A806K2K2_9BACT|nr:hypothetical protein [uncultured bacterium contig00160]